MADSLESQSLDMLYHSCSLPRTRSERFGQTAFIACGNRSSGHSRTPSMPRGHSNPLSNASEEVKMNLCQPGSTFAEIALIRRSLSLSLTLARSLWTFVRFRHFAEFFLTLDFSPATLPLPTNQSCLGTIAYPFSNTLSKHSPKTLLLVLIRNL